jgi:predicted HAD superfamily hydrolase
VPVASLYSVAPVYSGDAGCFSASPRALCKFRWCMNNCGQTGRKITALNNGVLNNPHAGSHMADTRSAVTAEVKSGICTYFKVFAVVIMKSYLF